MQNELLKSLHFCSLKREMRRVVLRDCGLDALTVALAFAYFETLVLRGAINKANRYAAGLPFEFVSFVITISIWKL